MATIEEKRKILTDFTAASISHDVDAIGAAITEDFTIYVAPSARKRGFEIPLRGRDKYLGFIRNIGNVPGMWRPSGFEIKKIYFDGDDAALWVRFQGDFEGGYPYDNEYVFTYRFVGDKIAEKREFVDTAYIDEQREAAAKHAKAQAG